jgi:hypothetical protein
VYEGKRWWGVVESSRQERGKPAAAQPEKCKEEPFVADIVTEREEEIGNLKKGALVFLMAKEYSLSAQHWP